MRSFPIRLSAPAVLVAAVVGITLHAQPSRADIIVLKNGNEIRGEVLEEGEQRVVVRFPGGVLQLKRKDIVEIRPQKRARYLLDVGESQIRRGNFHDAIETLRVAVRDTPDSEALGRKYREARKKYAGQLARWRRYDESVRLYRQLLEERPNDDSVAAEIEFLESERAEVLAEEKRGREELRDGDLETGIWRLGKIYEGFPDRREAIARPLATGCISQGLLLRDRKRWADAASLFERALEISPVTVDRLRKAYVECKIKSIGPHVQAGDFESVERLAREGLEVAPSAPSLNFFLGFAHDGKGEDAKAARLYAAILGKRAPSRPSREIAKLRSEAQAFIAQQNPDVDGAREDSSSEVLPGDFRTISTEHFSIRHKNTKIGQSVAFAAEAAYRELFSALGCTTHWRNACQVHVHPTQDDYLKNTSAGAWSGAAHRLDSSRGVFSKHTIVTYQGQPRLTDGLLKHEIAHALLTHRLNYPRAIPLWASEGFAVYTEPSYMHQFYDRICAQAKAQNTLIPIGDLFQAESYPDDRVQLFYGQSYSIVKYLLGRKGLDRYLEFLRDITANGLDTGKALRKHYRFEAELALENRWRYSLGKR